MIDRANIEAILPLTPQQSAMLLYCGEPGVRDVGFLPVQFDVVGELDLDVWCAAWGDVVARHAALRTTVQMPEGKAPMSIVWREADLPCEFEDLRDLATEAQAARVEAYWAAVRERGLPLDRAPVQRLATFALSEARHRVCWSCHHLLLDGWSSSIVAADVLAAYRARAEGGPRLRTPATDYLRYRRHLAEMEDREALDYWRDQLDGGDGGTLLVGAARGFEGREIETLSRRLEPRLSRALESRCTDDRFTASALARGLWGLLLAEVSGGVATDPAAPIAATFGAVVSGRSADLPDVDALAGFFSNVVPIRIALDRREPLVAALRRLRDEQLRSLPYEHLPLAGILSAGGCDRTPFDTLLLFQNLPVDRAPVAGLEMERYSSAVTSVYPLTLAVIPGERWQLRAMFDRRRLDGGWVAELVEAWVELLESVAESADRPIAEFAEMVSRRRLAERQRVAVAEVAESRNPPASSISTAALATSLVIDGFEPPKNRYELALVDLWQEVLGVNPIGVRDNFFDLGGSSIQAVQLFSHIDRRFDRRLPLRTLLERPTIEGLASVLGNGDLGSGDVDLKCLVPIHTAQGRDGTDVRRLFCIHAGGGHVLFYRDLAVRLGADFSVYGLQPIGLDGRESPLRSIEEIAERYLREIRVAQSEGPYHLLGYCWGATVAYEMAQQLRSSGESQTQVVLVDSSAPNRGDARPFADRIKSWVKRRVPLRRDHLRLLVSGSSERESIYLRLIQHACEDAFHAYTPGSYPDPVLFLQGEDSATWDRGFWDEGLIEDWQELAPELRIEQFDCNHDEFFLAPHVERTAARVAEWLA